LHETIYPRVFSLTPPPVDPVNTYLLLQHEMKRLVRSKNPLLVSLVLIPNRFVQRFLKGELDLLIESAFTSPLLSYVERKEDGFLITCPRAV
jgi:hypothetical protein